MLRMGQNFSEEEKLARVEEVMLEVYHKRNFAFKINFNEIILSA